MGKKNCIFLLPGKRSHLKKKQSKGRRPFGVFEIGPLHMYKKGMVEREGGVVERKSKRGCWACASQGVDGWMMELLTSETSDYSDWQTGQTCHMQPTTVYASVTNKEKKKKIRPLLHINTFFYNTRNDLSRFFFSHAYSVFFIFFNYYFYRSMRASLSPPHNNNSLAPPCHTLFRQSGDQSEKNLYIVRGGACLQYMGKG